ncbi:MAG: hypothetical protein LBH13_08245 [Cellulomonadaceae bacterium]|nr:hypothetical protein [Cellulomonadaceae bacterium]
MKFHLRMLMGPWAAAAALGFALAIGVMRGTPYLGEGMWTVRWFALGLWMVWPVIAALSAVDAARLTTPEARYLVLTARHGQRGYTAAAAWAAVPSAVVHLLVILTALAIGSVAHPRGGWPIIALAILAQLSTFLWFAALGSFIGRLLSPVLAGVVALAASLGLAQVLTNMGLGARGGFNPLGDSGASVSQIGLTWNPVHLVVQILVLAVTAMVLMMPRPQVVAGKLAPGFGTLAAAGITALALIALPALIPGESLLAVPVAPSACSGERPTICVFPEHERLAGPLVDDVRRLMDAADAHGYTSLIPERVEEASHRHIPADGKTLRSLGFVERETPGMAELIQTLVYPSWCPAVSSEEPPPSEFWLSLDSVVVTWMGLINEEYQPGVGGMALTPDGVASLMTAWQRCDVSADAPTPATE